MSMIFFYLVNVFILRIHQSNNSQVHSILNIYAQTDDNKYKLLLTRPATIHGARNGVHSPAFNVEYPVLWTIIVF